MTIPSSVLEAMAKAGCSPAQIIAAIKADEQDELERKAHRREKNRIYQRNHRARQQSKRLQSDVSADTLFPLEGSPTPLPKTSISPTPSLRSGDAPARMEFLADFWPLYPNKVGKPKALEAWLKARRLADLETIMAGVRRYVGKTDDRAWLNPATFLNQQRWTDQPATPPPRQQAQAPPPRNGMLAALERSRRELDDHDGPTIEASDIDRNRHGASQGFFSLAPPKRE